MVTIDVKLKSGELQHEAAKRTDNDVAQAVEAVQILCPDWAVMYIILEREG